MAYESTIEWTETTWNPVTGCTKISPGCKFCYAERFAERFRGVPGHPYEQGFDLKLHPDRLEQPSRWRQARIVFVNSMSDLFHEEVPDPFISSVFEAMEGTPQHIFQVLTKRPQQMGAFLARSGAVVPPNVWMGVSVERDDYLWRVDELRKVDAAVRFLSCEPLLGPLDGLDLSGIQWVIAGGESGPGARPMNVEWARALRDLCLSAGVPYFFKQWGGVRKHETGRTLDGRTWDEMPARDTSPSLP